MYINIFLFFLFLQTPGFRLENSFKLDTAHPKMISTSKTVIIASLRLSNTIYSLQCFKIIFSKVNFLISI